MSSAHGNFRKKKRKREREKKKQMKTKHCTNEKYLDTEIYIHTHIPTLNRKTKNFAFLRCKFFVNDFVSCVK